MKSINEYLGKQVLFLDGGTGSVLQAKGLQPGELPELWNISHSTEILQLGLDYYSAGSNIINTNTFGAFKTKFGDQLAKIINSACQNANLARKKILESDGNSQIPRFVSFDIGPTGKMIKPLGDLDFEDAISLYKETFRIGLQNEVDSITIETMNDIYEIKAAIIAAKETMSELNKNLPIFASMVFDEKAKTLTGSSPEICATVLESLGVAALGLNCSLGPKQMGNIVTRLLQSTDLPIFVKPNAGLPRSVNGQTVYDVTQNEFAKIVAGFCKEGAALVGGCCGTTPSYIQKLVAEVEKSSINIEQRKISKNSAITSGTKLVEFGKIPVLIGERINPTGKKKLKEALKNKDIPFILNEAVSQEEKGAQVLDVNVGLPEIDECQMMSLAITELQSVTDLPLQIDTSDSKTMEKAMRLYNGKPLINSVNGKQEVIEQIFPLVKKYGGMVVALTLDENGIPETAEGRIQIVEKIYQAAKEFGIAPENIIIDPLAMTVSTDDKAALATLQTVKYVKEQKNGLSILGVSNVSFGLPLREQITSVFFTMAMQNGLSAAIMNPNSVEMMKVWTCFKTLSGQDSQCQNYIEFADKIKTYDVIASSPATNQTNSNSHDKNCQKDSIFAQNDPLIKSIIKGLKENAKIETQKLLLECESSPKTGENSQNPALFVIDQKIIPALDIIGQAFEQKKAYLPQLLMAAEAAKEAFAVIKDKLDKSGIAEQSAGTVVIATVKGDIHDIGKNIVKVLLENYSFKVIDLGKDVSPTTILEAVQKEHAPLLGLSALMTTTVGAMEETLALIHEKAPWCKVFVGGAVLNEQYANQINADKYTKDAMASVKYCQEAMKHYSEKTEKN